MALPMMNFVIFSIPRMFIAQIAQVKPSSDGKEFLLFKKKEDFFK